MTYEFFWTKASPFSQWHPAQYILDDVTFQNAEQGMMYGKAKLFKDDTIAQQILATPDPAKVKALGRKVKNFKTDVWEQNREDIVYRNNISKFTQNPNLKKALLETGNRTLVEASPFDRIWGIGMSATNPNALDPTKWKGLNLLGKTLTRVKEQFQQS